MRSIWNLFLILFLSGSAFASDFDPCVQLGSDVSYQLTSPIPQRWDSSNFSDPRSHDPKNYVYVVHVVSASMSGAFYDLRHLNLGNYLPNIWASIVSNDAPYFFQNGSGLILEIKPDNVVSNDCYDTMFSFPINIKTLRPGAKDLADGFSQYKSQHPDVLSPFQMLRASVWPKAIAYESVRSSYLPKANSSDAYRNNEILLKGVGSSGHVVRAIGIFINKGDDELRVNAVRNFAAKFKLPIIEL